MKALSPRISTWPPCAGLGSKAPFICNACRSNPLRQFSVSSVKNAPLAPPSSGYTALTSRRLISLTGQDVLKFLQGLITSDMDKVGEKPGFYTGFLNPTGRVLHDVFIYRDTIGLGMADTKFDPGSPGYLIEVDEGQLPQLVGLVKRYSFRSKFIFKPLEPNEATLWQAWDDSKTGEAQGMLVHDEKGCIVVKDTRAPGLGCRLITKGEKNLQVDLEKTNRDAYTIRRYLRGVPEGQDDIQRGDALPLEMNMDVMGGIDFRKGCYIGQELTIRTKHRGIVRKRVLPCMFYGPDEAVPETLEYNPTTQLTRPQTQSAIKRKGRKTGTLLGGVGNIGIALCRLQAMTDFRVPGADTEPTYAADHEFGVEGDNGEKSVLVKAFVPDWLREKLDETNASPH